jgi:ligand-binding sensor domain-containing protein/signal transduction histidine kinase
MRIWILVWFSLAIVGWAAPTPAGTTFRYRQSFTINTWTTDEGLPQNSVTSIQQTRDGYLWFGTLNGLVRFDGLKFTVFDESNTPNLESSRIVRLFEDRVGRVWIGTENTGIALLTNGVFTSMGIGQGGFEKRLVSLAEDERHTLWLATANGDVWQYDQGQWQAFYPFAGRASNCRSLIAEPDGPVWLGTDWQQSSLGTEASVPPLKLALENTVLLNRLDFLLASRKTGYWRLADGRIQKCRGTRVEADLGPYPWGRERVSSAAEDLEGGLVIGTVGAGVYWLNATGQVTRISTNNGLSSDYVLAVCVDREGGLWVGTDGGGLNQVKRQVFSTLPLFVSEPVKAVQSLCADAQGGLWIGVNNGGAIYWRGETSRRYDLPQGLLNPYVWAIHCDRSNRVWAGTWGGGLFQLQQDRFQPVPLPFAGHREIRVLFEDRAGQLWVGTQNGLLRREDRGWRTFGVEQGLAPAAVQAMAEDADGNLWIGTVGAGLYQYRDGRFTAHRKSEHLPSDDITALLVDSQGALWIGTAGSGLVRHHRGQWTRYTRREGLASNSINYLLEDAQQGLWIGSNAGLTRVPCASLAGTGPAPLAARTFAKPDGLPTRECTLGSQPAAARTPDGRLWFPTIKGVVTVDPLQLSTNLVAPPVMIEQIASEGQPHEIPTMANPLRIAAGRERLEIHYTSLNLSAPGRARFRYQLAGFEETWTEAGNGRIARYSKLPPGNYHFQVTACNEDGIWNPEGASLVFEVLPPFWRTWWFLGLATLSLLGGITGTIQTISTRKLRQHQQQTRQKEALEKERARIARDLHDQLGASLTQISLLGELAEGDKDIPEEVEAHARQITQTSREITRVLDEIVWAVNPSNDTLDSLVTYLCKYAQDFFSVAGVRYRLEIPPNLPAVALPPDARHNLFLAAKEAITNVVRHAQATEAHVRLKLAADHFTLEIEDNGRGAPPPEQQAASKRNGLRNMRKRMEDAGGSFTLEPAPVKGAVVRLTAPLKRTAETANRTSP